MQPRHGTKKAKFKTIETPEVPANTIVREVDRMSLTSSDKGHVIFQSTRRSIYLTPDDLFSDSALENITNDALETIMQDLPVEEAENAEETVKTKRIRERTEQRASVCRACNSHRCRCADISQNKVREWMPLRAQTLDELLLYEDGACGITNDTLCSRCSIRKAALRCVECEGRALQCSECIVAEHKLLPLHRLQVCLCIFRTFAIANLRFRCGTGRLMFERHSATMIWLFNSVTTAAAALILPRLLDVSS